MGQEFQKRIKDFRPEYNFVQHEPQAGNYFPVNAAIYIKDVAKGLQLSLLTDRTRAGASLSEGTFDTMLHRRLLMDDSRGVGEALNETTVIYCTDHLLLDKTDSALKTVRTRLQYHYNVLQYVFGEPATPSSWSKYQQTYSLLKTPLPPNVYLQTLSPVQFPPSSNEFFVRLHHLYAAGEDPVMSKTATVSLDTLFANKKPIAITETNLTGIRSKAETIAKRLKWKTATEEKPAFTSHEPLPQGVYDINLNPMETRTFLVTFTETE